VYPTAPIELTQEELPEGKDFAEATSASSEKNWAWWQARQPHSAPFHEYVGLERGLAHIAAILERDGPFDGVIGFSQGAAAAAMTAALLEPGRQEAFAEVEKTADGIPFPLAFASLDHPPMRFMVSYSGFASTHPSYAAFYKPLITTPSLHYLGTLDTVLEESWARALLDSCEHRSTGPDGTLVVHPGGHSVPLGRRELLVVTGFIRSVYTPGQAQATSASKKLQDQDVLDMDLPF
jgi:fermentation-respiration switch protein FrsA (DUF1100 family)